MNGVIILMAVVTMCLGICTGILAFISRDMAQLLDRMRQQNSKKRIQPEQKFRGEF